MVVLLASFVPTIIANYRRAREAQNEARQVEISTNRQSKKEDKKKRKGANSKASGGSSSNADLEETTAHCAQLEREAAKAAEATRRAAEKEIQSMKERAKEEA